MSRLVGQKKVLNLKDKKVLFLDHDGVICLPKNFGSRWKEGRDGVFDDFDKKCVEIINEIIRETDCEIVISSDWKLYESLEYLQEFYLNQGIVKIPVATTYSVNTERFRYDEIRVDEIVSFIKEHGITEWVVVDDLNLHEDIEPIPTWNQRFIRTPKMNEGLKQLSKKDKVINILKTDIY